MNDFVNIVSTNITVISMRIARQNHSVSPVRQWDEHSYKRGIDCLVYIVHTVAEQWPPVNDRFIKKPNQQYSSSEIYVDVYIVKKYVLAATRPNLTALANFYSRFFS